jgi:hypothetical protein
MIDLNRLTPFVSGLGVAILREFQEEVANSASVYRLPSVPDHLIEQLPFSQQDVVEQWMTDYARLAAAPLLERISCLVGDIARFRQGALKEAAESKELMRLCAQKDHRNELQHARIKELEARVTELADSEVDKIMAMPEDRLNGLIRQEGRNPEDVSTIGRQAGELAIKSVRIMELESEIERYKSSIPNQGSAS